VILFLTDILGHKSSNAQLLADELAHNDHTVVVPDLFAGDPFQKDKNITIDTWLQSHTHSHILPIVNTVLAALREEFRPTKVGAVGYCLGAKYVTVLLNGKIDAGFNAHPSFVTLEDLAAIKAPLSIAAAGKFNPGVLMCARVCGGEGRVDPKRLTSACRNRSHIHPGAPPQIRRQAARDRSHLRDYPLLRGHPRLRRARKRRGQVGEVDEGESFQAGGGVVQVASRLKWIFKTAEERAMFLNDKYICVQTKWDTYWYH
jgi:hypothetical protein